jgi:hypothetical protein
MKRTKKQKSEVFASVASDAELTLTEYVKTETIEINVLDLKTMIRKFLRNEYLITEKELRSVEFKYMIRYDKFSGIKCEYQKGKNG